MTGKFDRMGLGFPNTVRVWGRSLLLLSALSACSSVPDSVNPVEWYKGTRDFITGKDEPAPAANTSPSKLQPPTTADNRKDTPKGLVPDRGNAQYAEPVRREVAPTRPLSRRPATEQTQVAAAAAPTAAGSAIQAAPLAAAPATNAGRADASPDAPPASVNMVPPSPANIPETVAVPGRPKRLQQQFEMRLAESASQNVHSGMVQMPEYGSATPAAYGRRDDEPIHLVPPGSNRKAKANTVAGGGKGFAAPLPVHEPAASFQVASVQFDGGAKLSRADQNAIAEVVRLYKQTKGVVRVVGYAAPPRRFTGAQSLALFDAPEDRADRVAQELNRRGIPAAKIMVAAAPGYAENGQDGAQIYLDVM